MDYEKEYKEALERARKEYKNHEAFKGFCEMLVHIFPALKDSKDERIKRKFLALIEWSKSYAASGITSGEAKEMTTWLEEQCEKKSAWSEEDERYLSYAIHAVEDMLGNNGKNTVTWLKSLKDRYTWKPSDEQMKQLYKYCPDNRPLTSLYEQLKKLMEE
jgi:hypothetical protein